MNYARLIILPFALVLAYLGFKVVYDNQESLSIYFIPLVICIVIILVFTSQINYYFYTKYPQVVDDKLKTLLMSYNPFYQALSEEGKEKFEQRLWLSIKQMDFMGMKLEGDVPADIQAISLIPSIELTYGLEEFIFYNYNRMVTYQHPFPSMQFNEWHACEHHKDDGVILFSLEQLMTSFSNRDEYYDIGLHEFVLIYLDDHPLNEWCDTDISWGELDEIANYDQGNIEAWIGLKQTDTHAAIIHHYFRFNDKFKKLQPIVHAAITKQFGRAKIFSN